VDYYVYLRFMETTIIAHYGQEMVNLLSGLRADILNIVAIIGKAYNVTSYYVNVGSPCGGQSSFAPLCAVKMSGLATIGAGWVIVAIGCTLFSAKAFRGSWVHRNTILGLMYRGFAIVALFASLFFCLYFCGVFHN
jgi:hypothetical protein